MPGTRTPSKSSPLRRLARAQVVRRRHRGLTADDIVFASFPKSGSTWMRFVLASVFTGEAVDFDTVTSASPPLGQHVGARAVVEERGRLVKSHDLPRFVGPVRPRVLYLVRDGRDVAVSYFHHRTRRGQESGTIDDFVVRFAQGRVGQWGSWQDHVAAWQAATAASPSPSTVLRYEDLMSDAASALTTSCAELGLQLPVADVEEALARNDVEGMKAKEARSTHVASQTKREGSFVRGAGTGGWKSALQPETVAVFEEAAGEQLLAMGYELSAARR